MASRDRSNDSVDFEPVTGISSYTIFYYFICMWVMYFDHLFMITISKQICASDSFLHYAFSCYVLSTKEKYFRSIDAKGNGHIAAVQYICISFASTPVFPASHPFCEDLLSFNKFIFLN